MNFFKQFNISKGFSNESFFIKKRTVCIKHINGNITEHKDITDPWKYIAKVKKMPDVESAWIKD